MNNNLIELETNFIKALSQPTRLKIVYFLRGGERCACEIIPKMKEEQSTISRHLNYLKNAGILQSRKEGVSIYYKIKDKRIFSLLSLVDEMIKTQIKNKVESIKTL